MAKKVIRFDLSEAGIDKAIKELEQYKREIPRKAYIFRKRIADLTKKYAQTGFNNAIVDDYLDGYYKVANVDVTVNPVSDNVTLVVANGEDAIWAEFGSGVFHNGAVGTSPHPKGEELGFRIGTYGKGKGKQKTWGFADDDGLHLTHGSPASMPLYNALQMVTMDIYHIAKEVFG